MKKLLIVCGSTATGKTGLALKLAKKIKGEIISVDSRQVYRYLDIITGKDLPEDSKSSWKKSEIENKNKDLQIGYYSVEGIKIWLYDLVDPKYPFNVSDWLDCAQAVVDDVWQRGKTPILVGGTGFYFQAFLKGIGTLNIPPDWKLRDKLGTFSVIQLAELLKKTDLKKWLVMNNSDQHNPHRLIRALEIANWIKKDKKNNLANEVIKKIKEKSSLFSTLTVVLDAAYPFLYQRIDKRVETRVENGAEKEITMLLRKGYDFKNSVLGRTIGYSEWQDYFQDKTISDKEAIIQRWKYDEHFYARRQKTWFKKTFPQNQKNKWFDISRKDWENKVEKQVLIWYNQIKDAKKN
jgi:tRNA dimethylallyltransferase